MPAVAEARRPPQRGLRVAADPDGGMGLLHRLRQTLDGIEAVERALERGRAFRPQRLEDAQVLVADGATTVEVGGAERLELLAQPAYAHPHRHPPADSTSMVASVLAVATGLR